MSPQRPIKANICQTRSNKKWSTYDKHLIACTGDKQGPASFQKEIQHTRTLRATDYVVPDVSRFTAVHTVENSANRDGTHKPLSHRSMNSLRIAIDSGTPLVVRHTMSTLNQMNTLASWEKHVRSNDTQLVQRSGNGPMPLGPAWAGNWRVETGTGMSTDNAVRDWLSSAAQSEIPYQLHMIQRQLDELAADIALRYPTNAAIKYPAFIAGNISQDINELRYFGGPCHYDDYNNLAHVICGSKIFFTAPYADLKHVGVRQDTLTDEGLPFPLTGYPNERLHVIPDNGHTARWLVACLNPGDILYIPSREWHWVLSKPYSVMTNIWVPAPVGDQH